MSTAPSPMIPIYAPDGTLGSVSYEQLHDALKGGGTIAARIQAPDGTPGYIPADKVADALKSGAKRLPVDLSAPATTTDHEPIELRPLFLCAGDADVDVLAGKGPPVVLVQ